MFLCNHWSTYQSSQMKSLQLFYVTSTNKCYLLSPGSSPTAIVLRREIAELGCDHEEADTRILFHSRHAAKGHLQLIIRSPDTDVFVLAIAMQKSIGKEMYFMTGTGNKFRVLDVTIVSDELGEELCASLPGFHAFSGMFSYYGLDISKQFLKKNNLCLKVVTQRAHFMAKVN